MKKLQHSEVKIEGIKLAVSRFYKTDAFLCRKILLESIRWFLCQYDQRKEEECLEKALYHMKAYGELGFSYKDIKDQSERIFDLLNLDKEERKTFRGLFCKEIVVNKTRINRLLGSWNPVYHSMKIGDAVKDILQKVNEQEDGSFLYHCGREIAMDGEERLWEHTFMLQIQNGEAIFHDMNHNQYYLLLKEGTDASNRNYS